MVKLKRIFPKTEFAKNVYTLITGTTLAQAIPVAISPILTRIYSPEEMGLFALYMSIVTVISVIATGRYDFAILLPKTNVEAANLVVLAMSITVVVSLLLLGVTIVFNDPIGLLLGNPDIGSWLFFVPLSVLLTGGYQSLNCWSNRQKHYKRIAVSRVAQSSAMCSTHVGAGFAGAGATGLIGGAIAGQLVSTLVLGRMIWTEDQQLLKKIRLKRVWGRAIRYIDFPKFSLLGSVLNSASIQSPILLLTALFSLTSVGFFMLTQRVISSPVSIIAQAIGAVFRQEASHAYIQHGNCVPQYKSTFKKLVTISTLPFIVFFFVAPDLFEVIFGQQWRVSGQYAQILTPMFYLKFNVNPLSTMFLIAEKQKLNLLWQMALFCSTVGSFVMGFLFSDIFIALIAFSVSYSILYIVNGLMTWRFAKGITEQNSVVHL